ncbi:MAG: DinB family protein [Saprospiraceae bacterium]|nr:DinB family protein [Saprospiraceae bacterium]
MKFESRSLLDDLERLTDRLSQVAKDYFGDLNEEQLNWRPQLNGWSIAECLEHLNRISATYLVRTEQYIQKSITKRKLSKKYFESNWLTNSIINKITLGDDNRPRTYMRALKQYDPAYKSKNEASSLLPGQNVLEQFLSSQKQLLELLKLSEQVNLKVKIPTHYFFKLPLGDVLRFLVRHTERHIVQAQRVRNEEAFPSSSA